jgi:uncharacterized membrane protein YedE/YeeE
VRGKLSRLAAFACGLVFALGLGISGMTQPSKVLGFLDVAGAWDPSLMFVIAGAVLPGLVAFALILRRPAPLLEASFHMPTRRSVDARLIAGAALFGVGWGLSGYCPGPAVLSIATGAPGALVFVASMVVGMVAFSRMPRPYGLSAARTAGQGFPGGNS